MPYDGRAVANYIIDRCDQNGRTISNLSLQKLVFFCHVWTLVKLRKPLVNEQFEAWPYGPVLPYVYRSFSKFGEARITGKALAFDRTTGQQIEAVASFDHETLEVITSVVDSYGKLSASQLVELSHIGDGPWFNIRNHAGKVNPGMRIQNDSIIEYYSTKSNSFLMQ